MAKMSGNESQREKNERQKKVTVEARKHLREIQAGQDEAADPRSGKLKHLFRENEAIHEKAETVVQNGLVSQAFYHLSVKANEQAQKLSTGLKEYDVASFVAKLKERGGMVAGEGGAAGGARGRGRRAAASDDEEGEELAEYAFDFGEFGGDVLEFFGTTPAVDFMLGATEIKPRVVKERAPREPRKKQQTKVTTAKELTGDDAAGQTETDKQIEEMNSILEKEKKGNFFKFVIDPSSFSRSVENIFHSSFLVKDGRSRLEVIRGEPTIIAKPDAVQQIGGNMSTSQVIMRFDHETWRSATSEYRIDKAVLPSKTSSKRSRPDGNPGDDDRPTRLSRRS